MTESNINKESRAWSWNPAVVQQPREQCLETTSIHFHHETMCAGKVMLFFFQLLLAGTRESQRTEIVSFTKLTIEARLSEATEQAFSQNGN